MPNPFISMFAADRQNDILGLNNFVNLLIGGGQSAEPDQQQSMSPPMGTQVAPGPQLPTPPQGVWQPPTTQQLGESRAPDRPTGIAGRLYDGMLKRGIPPHIAQGFLM